MADLQPGRWYHLIGGDRVRVDAVDAEAGMVTVADARGQTQRLTRSAFVGALAEAGGDRPVGGVATATRQPDPAAIDPAATDLDLDAIDDRLSALLAGDDDGPVATPEFDPLLQELSELDQMLDDAPVAADPKPRPAAVPAPDTTAGPGVAATSAAAGDASPREAPEEGAATAPPGHSAPPPRPPAHDRDVAAESAPAATVAPAAAASRGRNAAPAVPVADPPDPRPRSRVEDRPAAPDGAARGRRSAAAEPPRAPRTSPPPPADPAPGTTGELDFGQAPEEAVAGLGLSPLALGMLLGMIVLTGLAGGLVLKSRIDALDEQFVQVDQRLQVLMGDVRRQGETLRGLAANPAPPSAPSAPPAPGAAADPAGIAALERGLAAQRQQVETVAQAVARHDSQLAEIERRTARVEQRPATAPARQAAPGGYVVVLASLPLRDQALQQLDLLRAKGLKAELREAQVNGRTWYRVQVEGFADREAADRYAREATTRHGVDGVWVAAP